MQHPGEPAAQTVGLAILQRLRAENGHVSAVMAQVFRDQRVAAAIKADVADRVYAIVRSQRLLDHLIERLSVSPVRDGARDRARWLVRGFLDGAVTAAAARRQLPHFDWRRVDEIVHEVQTLADAATRLALAESLPDWLGSRWIATFGVDEAFEMAGAFNRPAPQTIRANTIQGDRDGLAARLRARGLVVAPTPRASQGLIVESRTDLFRLPEFGQGLFEVQDEGSQLVSELVAPPPGGAVLDACAGTGGKTLHLGALLRGQGHVVAVGVGTTGQRQLAELRRRARRAGLHNVRFVAVEEAEPEPPFLSPSRATGTGSVRVGAAIESARGGLATWIGRIDRVLVDAPCSGLGVLRRNPETRWRLRADDIERLAALQRAILERFAPCVRPGGRLVYSTCSVLPEENDDVVRGFLSAHAEFVPVDAKEILGSERAEAVGDGRVLRLLPHRHGTDGFFAAVMRRQRSRRATDSGP